MLAEISSLTVGSEGQFKVHRMSIFLARLVQTRAGEPEPVFFGCSEPDWLNKLLELTRQGLWATLLIGYLLII